MYIFVNKGGFMKLNYTKYRLANFISINKIVTIHYYEFSKDFTFEGESHNFWEMVYVDKGQVNISANSKKFTLKQGQVAFHKPNEFHTICTDGINAAEVFVIAFVCSSAAMEFFKSNITSLTQKLKKQMFSIIDECLSTFEIMPITGVELIMKENETLTFEEAVARLEQIVRAMEEGKLSLDDSLKAFEEGIALVRFCNGRLDAAEQRIRILVSGEDGTVGEQPFRPTGA